MPIYSVGARLERLRAMNRAVQADQGRAHTALHHGLSLLSCEQQLAWERLGRRASSRHFFSAAIAACCSCIAYLSFAWLVVRMRLSRSHVLVYGIDLTDSPYRADARMGAIYRFLHERGIPYGEIFHTVFGRKCIVNMAFRRRSGLYLDIARDFFDFFSLRAAPVDDVEVLFRRMTHRPREIALLRTMLRLTGARAILTIDDTRYYYPLLFAARECGIAVHAFQHGRFNAYMPGWSQPDIDPAICPFPDTVFVRNSYWRDALLRISGAAALHAERVIVGGEAGIKGTPLIRLNAPRDDGFMTFLIPQEDDVPEKEIVALIHAILRVPHTRIIYKLRRHRRHPSFVGDFATNAFEVRYEIDADVWETIDAVLGAYSTFLYEAVEMGRPVGIVETDMTQADDLVVADLARIVRRAYSADDACSVAGIPWDAVVARRAVFGATPNINKALSAILPV